MAADSNQLFDHIVADKQVDAKRSRELGAFGMIHSVEIRPIYSKSYD